MTREIRSVRAAAQEALGAFRLDEFAPFAWLLAVELLVLGLAMNLHTAWGMATAGWLTERLAGDRPLHYPAFYAFLPTLLTNVEAVLFTLAGSALIPLAVIRVLRPLHPETFPPGTTGARVRQAFPAVLAAALVAEALIVGWQWIINNRSVVQAIGGVLRGGTAAMVAVAVLAMLVGYALWTLFVYVPVAAVQPGRSAGAALAEGIREGVARFFPTYLVVIGLSLPAAAVLLVLQVMGEFLVGQIRPEIIGVLIGLYVVFSVLATFFVYNAASRYHQARLRDGGEAPEGVTAT
jgi:hypothetical protein